MIDFFIQKVRPYKIEDGYRAICLAYEFERDREILDDLKEKAENLAEKVRPYSASGKERSYEARVYDAFGGLVAEHAFRRYIEFLAKHSKNVSLLEDELSDEDEGFSALNQVDVPLLIDGNRVNVEVRSSFDDYSNTGELLGVHRSKGNFSLIGWYSHENKPYEEKKDFYVSVVHRSSPERLFNRLREALFGAVILGAASRERLEEKGHPTNLGQRGALYQVINPLIKYNDPVFEINRLIGFKISRPEFDAITPFISYASLDK